MRSAASSSDAPAASLEALEATEVFEGPNGTVLDEEGNLAVARDEEMDHEEELPTDAFDPNQSRAERVAAQRERKFRDGRTEGPVVRTQQGEIMGVTLPAEPDAHQPTYQEVDLFSGVPYALSPEGVRRFKAPEAFEAGARWILRAAVQRAESCIQPVSKVVNRNGFIGTENCLVLNVWRPARARARGAKMPVMVYLLDGNQLRGHLSVRKGSKLAAAQDVIVVNVMFRLGALGHFASEALATPANHRFAGSVGNWGLLDQVVALEWIQQNIEAFGGDKDRVTLWGACSGGTNVLFHLLSPFSRGLFHRAIIQSTMVNRFVFQELEDTYKFFEWFAREAVGVVPAADGTYRNSVEGFKSLRWYANRREGMSRFQIPVGSIEHMGEIPEWQNPLYPQVSFGPVVDHVALTGQPFDLIARGQFHRVPLIVGVTTHETAAMILGASTLKMGFNGIPTSHSQIDSVLRHILGSVEAVERVKALIPYEGFEKEYRRGKTAKREWIIRVLRELLFHGPAQFLARAWNSQNVAAYMYEFGVRVIPNMIGRLPLLVVKGGRTVQIKQAGAFHVSDVSLALMLFSDSKGRLSITKDLFSLYMGPTWGGKKRHHWAAHVLSTAFTNFAYEGNPNIDRPRSNAQEAHFNIRQLTNGNVWNCAAGWNPDGAATAPGFFILRGEDSKEGSLEVRMQDFPDNGVETPGDLTCGWTFAEWVASVEGSGLNPRWMDNRVTASLTTKPAVPLSDLDSSTGA